MSRGRTKQPFSQVGGVVVDFGERRRRRMESGRAAAMGEEDVRQIALQLFGAMREHEQGARKAFGELAKEWLVRLRRVGGPDNERRHLAHLATLDELREGELTVSAIDAVLLELEDAGALGPASLNKLRSTGKLVIDYAQANGQWRGFNPFAKVKRRKVPRKQYTPLTLDELERAMACLKPHRRRMARVSLYTGERPGELLALWKSDVDLVGRMINVHRSHARDTTKTGEPRRIAIPAAVLEDLREAIRVSPSHLVFPGQDGEQQRRDTKLSRMLQHGLRLAGICSSWRYACRRRGCGFKDELAERNPHRRCPTCFWTLHCIGVPKHFTYYDLRHAMATLARERGADPLCIKVQLGHVARGDPTDDVYTHVTDEKLRAELDKLCPQAPGTGGQF